MNRRGFSLVELLITIAILGILVNLALPAISRMRRRAEATRVVGDFHAIRIAAMDRHAADGAFPPTESFGKVPAKLVPGLPRGFAFRYRKLEYRWFSLTWKDKGGNHVLAGLEIRGSMDPKLMAAIRAAYRGPMIFISSTDFALMIE